ncbi:MAG: UxaA family hydrolase [Eubacteriales bacterium]|jgi:altronate hydrolase
MNEQQLTKKELIKVSPLDTVAVALGDLCSGESYTVDGVTVTLKNDIPFGHKVALQDIAEGENIIKYGHPIGHARCAITKGEHVHAHNLKTNLDGILEYTYHKNEAALKGFDEHIEATFEGYVRPDGRVGTRNEVWIIPTVGCVNVTAERLCNEARKRFGDRVEAINCYTHNVGCSQLGRDQENTMRLLSGLIHHPNAGAVLVVSLGCENNNLEVFAPYLGEVDPNRVKFMVTQDVEDEYETGIQLLDELTQYASQFKRETVSAKHLVVGFKCGASDAFSGITANPLVGRLNDRIVKCGGSTILTEVPEMFGAETLLMERAVDKSTFDDVVKLINDYKEYFIRYNQTIYENPSPGNKKGGISSLEEKSLGCTQKGGHAPVVACLDYGQQVVKNGLNLLTGSGNDAVSCTNLVCSGATIVCFTTGRGNPYGTPVPTVKVASNTRLATRKPNWIDFNAGQILDGNSFEQATDNFFNYILEVASGKKTNNEINGYQEISIFRDGVIL